MEFYYVKDPYVDIHPGFLKGPFLKEEIFLLEAIANIIGQTLERRAFEEERIKLYCENQN